MFGNFNFADHIAIICANIDMQCRIELQRRILVSERDYVTALTSRIRDQIKGRFKLNSHAQTLSPKIENDNGVDGIIVFKIGSEIKAGIFEAKRPQVLKPNYAWDYITSRNESHFSEQIKKQRKWKDQLAIWEMFFNEGVQGTQSPPFDFFGSSCVWHENAFRFMRANHLISSRWTTPKLKILLQQDCVNFYTVIYNILSCQNGKVYQTKPKSQSFTFKSETEIESSFTIPIPLNDEVNFNDRIQDFLTSNDLDNYTFLNLTE